MSNTAQKRVEQKINNDIVEAAMNILRSRLRKPGSLVGRQEDIGAFVSLHISTLEKEVFGAILMDTHNRYITHEVLFTGTVLHCQVYPREVVKFALKHNASKLVLFHNHPSGSLNPSPEDKEITKTLVDVCKFMDIQIVDHIIVHNDTSFSFFENYLLER